MNTDKEKNERNNERKLDLTTEHETIKNTRLNTDSRY